jgi:hypothetical protein
MATAKALPIFIDRFPGQKEGAPEPLLHTRSPKEDKQMTSGRSHWMELRIGEIE